MPIREFDIPLSGRGKVKEVPVSKARQTRHARQVAKAAEARVQEALKVGKRGEPGPAGRRVGAAKGPRPMGARQTMAAAERGPAKAPAPTRGGKVPTPGRYGPKGPGRFAMRPGTATPQRYHPAIRRAQFEIQRAARAARRAKGAEAAAKVGRAMVRYTPPVVQKAVEAVAEAAPAISKGGRISRVAGAVKRVATGATGKAMVAKGLEKGIIRGLPRILVGTGMRVAGPVGMVYGTAVGARDIGIAGKEAYKGGQAYKELGSTIAGARKYGVQVKRKGLIRGLLTGDPGLQVSYTQPTRALPKAKAPGLGFKKPKTPKVM